MFWLGFVLVLLLVNGDEPDPRKSLREACSADIDKYCKGEAGTWAYSCLIEYKSKLSTSCADYIGATALGACNDDVRTYCSSESSVSGIVNCLDDHKSSLSQSCLANVNSRDSPTNEWVILQQQYLEATRRTAVLSIVLLSVPLLVGFLALRNMKMLNEVQDLEMKKMLNNQSSTEQLTENVLTIDNSESAELTLDIGFMDISYFTVSESLLTTKSLKKKKIINNISGEFKHNSICAIMGPSGSGKTTLLKLLSGQIFTGQYCGRRYLNGILTDSSKYVKVMNTQGYVPQQDYFLESLSVWQCLMYAALLRIRENVSVENKIKKAIEVMKEVGLESVAHTILSTDTHSHQSKGISGGQRRRLSIAQALLGFPQALLLDEPTSGLDASTSLKLVNMLYRLSRRRKATIAFTIHQPRSEMFDLFDDLILLGAGGFLIYSGPSSSAAALISRAPTIALNIANYENPGDFIMDVLDNSTPELEGRIASETQIYAANVRRNILNMGQSALAALKPLSRLGTVNDRNYVGDNGEYEMISLDESIHDDSEDNDFTSVCNSDPDQLTMIENSSPPPETQINININENHCDQTRYIMELNNVYLASDEYAALKQKYPCPLNSHIESEIIFTYSLQFITNYIMKYFLNYCQNSSAPEISELDATVQKVLQTATSPNLNNWEQIWILFSRRIHAQWPSATELTAFFLQMALIGFVTCFTFSYKVSTELEYPYQVLMVLVMISTYLMILQYLSLVPEYLGERKIIIAEKTANYIGIFPYIISAALTEIPRAVLQTVFFFVTIYTIRPINPNHTNQLFFLACLMVGVCAWQAQIAVCAVLSDQISYVYSLTFLVLGSGTLFGGLIIRLNKIPSIFKAFYFLSVSAVTQRAIVVNDMECCYLSTTCNSLIVDAKNFQSSIPENAPSRRVLYNNSSVSLSLTHIMQTALFVLPNNDYIHKLYSETPTLDQLLDHEVNIKEKLMLNNTNSLDNKTKFVKNVTSIVSELNAFCPPGLQFSGDGTDEGNLGRLYLKFMDLDHDRPFLSLQILFMINIMFRLLAGLILIHRSKSRYQLVYITSLAETSELNMDNIDSQHHGVQG